MQINKDTLLFGSFAHKAGNNGCKIFNSAFSYYNLNAIYKSFSVNDIQKAVLAAKVLDFKGFGITMPFKKEILTYIDKLTDEVEIIGATNTIVNEDGLFVAYNTDYLAAETILFEETFENEKIYILGNGGFSAAVQFAANKLKLSFEIIDRKKWNEIPDIKESIVFNCTPVLCSNIDPSNKIIDSSIDTKTGYRLSLIQASYQFKLYTGLEFPIKKI